MDKTNSAKKCNKRWSSSERNPIKHLGPKESRVEWKSNEDIQARKQQRK